MRYIKIWMQQHLIIIMRFKNVFIAFLSASSGYQTQISNPSQVLTIKPNPWHLLLLITCNLLIILVDKVVKKLKFKILIYSYFFWPIFFSRSITALPQELWVFRPVPLVLIPGFRVIYQYIFLNTCSYLGIMGLFVSLISSN